MTEARFVATFAKYKKDPQGLDFTGFSSAIREFTETKEPSDETEQNGLFMLFSFFDTNKNNFLSEKEYMSALGYLPARYKTLKEAVYMALFKVTDTNGSGKVNVSEFLKFKKMEGTESSKKVAQDLIASVDMNGDGKLNIDEWLNLFI
ncbi:hypothetical protein EIN_405250 [Entamoeba invadens IP1]|uniref:EF-hand domain-containing protein n=1 Tax=Entamoeba invadens IP1 TaxID=370355 RepID=A0A0A1UAB4_ENTIV|nr:hypothetical protein EIN_405250 [Entamoeba invadens IP1]ELP90111.1 hypothetical protein EIN_405250 [Entamoeba invadens IP1]|eukprot:XP_004256882.1 hypothetical protein EIN_405250 [Entamoeba invadens IP1]